MRILFSALVAVSIAASANAALSKEYANFPSGPAQLLFTAEEKDDWNHVETDELARAFIEKFWARRDPTPGTLANEYRDGFDKRVKTADINYSNAKQKGSVTDRGKVYILMGLPTNLQKTEKKSSNVQTFTPQMPRRGLDEIDASANRSVQAYTSKEVWIWDQGKSKLPLGQPKVELIFVDQYDSNEWKLDRLPSTDPLVVFERVAKGFIFQPGATLDASTYTDAAPAAAPAPAKFKNDALRAAVDEIRAGKAGATNLFVSSSEFVTPSGDHFVPVQLYAPTGTGLDANAPVTFFGAIDQGDQTVAVFETPATLQPSNGAVYVARSLVLAPGEYRGIFGVAVQGKAPVVTAANISVAGIDKDAAGVSALMLSNHIFTMSEAQAPTDPYTFGGMRVVLKSDGTFRTKDELWYFIELRNPGVDPASKAPKLTVKLSLTGKTAQGAPVKMLAPAEETPAQELKGVPGHWGVGQSIPLDSFKPGEYTLAVKVTDVTSNHSYDLSSNFRIVE